MAEDGLGPHALSPAELQRRLQAERAGVAFLLFRDDAGELRIQALDRASERVTIGRGSGADVRLGWDGEVSRVHAELTRVADEWTVADDGLSRNGTYLNGDRIHTRARLRDGDRLRLGRTSLLFRADAKDGATRATSVASGAPAPPALSEAQRRVLVALCRPFAGGAAFATPATNQQIAGELFLSVEAVKSHLRVLFERFGVQALPQNRKRVRLAELAFETGAVSERDLA